MSLLLETSLPLPLLKRGKVRDVYRLGDRLLIVSTDRISAFDYVLPCGVPEKGKVLNQLSAFWFARTAHIVPNHLVRVIDSLKALREVMATIPTVIARAESPKQSPAPEASLVGRSMVTAHARRIPVECVVRGYLAGSAWAEYKRSGRVGGIPLPSGMEESQEFPQPLFTPTTKSDVEHDRPLTADDVKELGIERLMPQMEEKSRLIYRFARDFAAARGIIIADTKFEFGLIDGRLSLIDELLTPDSSRFWDSSRYQPGKPQESLDKQPVRDWLLASGWDQNSPPPPLPPGVVRATTRRYLKIYSLFTGE